MQINFYHLERQPVEAALPKLLEKVLAAGHRAAVFCAEQATMRSLDEALWSYDPASFLPHGCDGGGHADLQPVFLTCVRDVPNKAGILVALENQLPDDLDAFERCLYMFNGQADAQLAQARSDWKTLKAAGHDLTYWQQGEAGGWAKKA